jgi:phosphotransferase system HPr (HPr) family protein
MSFLDRFKTHTIQLTVTSTAGFHLRPAAKFANLAKSFTSHITLHHNQKSLSAKLVNGIIGLGLKHSDSFRLSAKGKDAKEALKALQILFHELMREETPLKHITKEEIDYHTPTLEGEIIARGVAIGELTPMQTTTQQHKGLPFQEALTQTKKMLQNRKGAIFEAQFALLESMTENSITNLETFETNITKEIERLEQTPLKAKRVDYLDLLQHLKSAMGYTTTLHLPSAPSILLAKTLLPSHIEILQTSHIVGVILTQTTLTSHTAILLRATNIPSLILNETLDKVPQKGVAILDASAGKLMVSPTTQEIRHAQQRVKKLQITQQENYHKRETPAITTKGVTIEVMANIKDLKSAKEAVTFGAKKVGLLRTEFLFTDQKPTFETQLNTYQEIFSHFESTTIRTLDVGGDKALPYISLPHEENPFLGIRGVRLFKTHPDIMQEQLLAILTAAQHHSVKIMFPMVSCVVEFQKLKEHISHIASTHQLNLDHIEFGIMLEVPSVLFLLDAFNEVVDFYSIGTNDLTQYLFAIERTHPTLTTNPHSSVVFDAIEYIVQKANKPVSICGELASDKEAIGRLVDIGITKLSMNATAIPESKALIRNL